MMERSSGRIYYLMGASGAGKDSLIKYVKDNLKDRKSYHFARRYVTRTPPGENDIEVDQKTFRQLLDSCNLVLHWQRHGINYGFGKEMEKALAEGKRVIINGSRGHYSIAKAAYPDLIGILIKANPQILEQRLHRRKRESASEISARMAEADKFQQLEKEGMDIHIIDNSAKLHIAGNQLLAILKG